MWVLESPGDFLGGKRLWLKPGKKYLFGRVKKDGVRFAIDHKTVSRKHFIIDVADVRDGETGRVHDRTKIQIIDQNSKSGTTVNGHLLKGTGLLSRELDQPENSVRPGNTEELIIQWQPCVITFNLMKKELKLGVLKQKQERARHLGVKVIAEFAQDHTTHLVVAKRNTPKSLQALITGRYLVTETFIEAIEYAATPSSLDVEEDASQLELDFDAAWPDPMNHLPPPGREPTLRQAESYQPRQDRGQIFEDYAFVFADKSQYETLLPVITTGHGKALHLNVVEGRTTINDVYEFVQNAGGRNLSKPIQDLSEKGGVILVKCNTADEAKEWANNLFQQIALRLDQRVIDQSEFLDAVLANDASLLKQRLPHHGSVEGKIVPSPVVANQPLEYFSQSKSTEPETDQGGLTEANGLGSSDAQSSFRHPHGVSAGRIQHQPDLEPRKANDSNRRDRFRRPHPSITKGFDDSFDVENVVDFDGEEDDTTGMAQDEQTIKAEPQSMGPQRTSPTREHEADNSFDEEMDNLLPASTAMRKDALELELETKRQGLLASATLNSGTSSTRSKKEKRKEVEINVREVARQQRNKELEEVRKKEAQMMDLPPVNEEDTGPANLAVVEVLQIRARKPKDAFTNRINPEDDPRWKPEWNGKKNFKGFRPQSAGLTRRLGHAEKVIVPLIEVKRRADGLGERYWEKTEEQKEADRRKREKEKRRTQRNMAIQNLNHYRQTSEDDSDGPENKVDDQPQNSPVGERLQEEGEGKSEHDMYLDESETARANNLQTSGLTQIQAQTLSEARKRPGSSDRTATKQNKRQKTLPVTTVHRSESDDSDDMKFKFGARRWRREDG